VSRKVSAKPHYTRRRDTGDGVAVILMVNGIIADTRVYRRPEAAVRCMRLWEQTRADALAVTLTASEVWEAAMYQRGLSDSSGPDSVRLAAIMGDTSPSRFMGTFEPLKV
jgi:hypothetical protein